MSRSRAELSIAIADERPVQALSVEVDIEHTYVGDLIVTLAPPESLASALDTTPIVLHNRLGGGRDNLKQSYDKTSIPGLEQILGRSLQGIWTLQVKDEARYDTGLIRGFTLKVSY